MLLHGTRTTSRDPREPMDYQLSPLVVDSVPVAVTLNVRVADDGGWRGRLAFGDPGGGERVTAEIFRAGSEDELWHAVQDLREHHLRDLYRSLG